MKRTWRAILALTLVCAVALTAAAMALGSKALPLTMTDACTIGNRRRRGPAYGRPHRHGAKPPAMAPWTTTLPPTPPTHPSGWRTAIGAGSGSLTAMATTSSACW